MANTNNTDTNKISPSNDVFLERAKVLFEGVEVPFNSVSVSYGIGSLPTCTVVVPAARIIRDLPETTKVWVLYKNPEDTETDPWLILFDGELGAMSYSYNAASGVLVFNVVHSMELLNKVQLITQDAAAPLTDTGNIAYAGITSIMKIGGTSFADATILKGLFGTKEQQKSDTAPVRGFKNMAELVAGVIGSILNGKTKAAATKVFRERLLTKGKLLERIFGVSITNVNSIIDKVLASIK